ncbi:peptidoglycan DD-metalloendopeptidase family protein [Curtobacterium sp. MCSS17_015]|uniref:peptidoglycan DD-metalloendopeptidase family protein n=1 Tax=Curtobacterium sp. MCSS17_015 TaxID=2175666 RepID=UPI0011B675AE|nr:peptidoglycan DD-metalloendopeptidase family protein [Curtobacterium sp. MCSS17_015]WIB26736.1 peptidoglycan DD-metalloendopeptidase family protein [Curtobacterium sp. MCSS17_015]
MRRTTSTRLMAVVTAVVVAVTGSVVVSAPASAATSAGSVKAGTWLNPGDSLTSRNGQFQLVMQGDGNLVEYGIGRKVLWASGTAGWSGASTVVNKDGVVTIQRKGQLIARYGTSGRVGKRLQIGADGVITSLDTADRVVWQVTAFQDSVGAGQVIAPGTVLRSDASSARTLTMRSDGNLVQAVSGRATWESKTSGHPGAYAAVQTDGNLVVYGADKKALWASHTSRAGAGQLLVQVDGNVVLYGKAGTRVWSTKKVTGLLWPVNGTAVSGRYGDDRGAGHVPRYHQGTDAPVKVGTPVYGSGKGTVTTVVQNHASYGNYIVVTYGLTTVLTAHLSKIQVKKGQIVSATTEIAKSGNTGQSTGPHVHLETRVNNTLKDPLSILHFR